jgi:hypothetical protein
MEFPYWKMISNLSYVVVNPSADKTFHTGDHVIQYPDGSIFCREAQGWIDSNDVPEAAKGMIVTPDLIWAKKRIDSLKIQIKIIEEQYGIGDYGKQ